VSFSDAMPGTITGEIVAEFILWLRRKELLDRASATSKSSLHVDLLLSVP
jgi:hypothetical protein